MTFDGKRTEISSHTNSPYDLPAMLILIDYAEQGERISVVATAQRWDLNTKLN